MLAAQQVAEIVYIPSFGFDETSKFQVGTLSTNVKGVAAGGRTVDIVMHGVFIITGGATKDVLNAVVNKLFVLGRKLLARWQQKFKGVKTATAAPTSGAGCS
eukprot:2788303-Pleurochrysis_carterae.AAC.1